LNDAGYYESKNKGKNNTAALCKVTIQNKSGKTVYFDCINSGESNYDYGILSNVGQTLDSTSNAETYYKKSFRGKSSTSVQTVNYGVIEGVIYVKFRKDGSSSEGNDSLQFTVRFV
jgi:hypothetical protein